MGYARHIGRVGALRVGALVVALGVGAAVASTPGIAYAQPSDSDSASSSTGDASSPTHGAASSSGSGGTDSSAQSPRRGVRVGSPHRSQLHRLPRSSPSPSPSGSADKPSQAVVDSDAPAGDDTHAVGAASADSAAGGVPLSPVPGGVSSSPPLISPSSPPALAQDDAEAASPRRSLRIDPPGPSQVSAPDSVSGDSAYQRVSGRPTGGRGARILTQPDAGDTDLSVAATAGHSTRPSDDLSVAGPSTRSSGQSQTLSIAAVADAPARYSLVAPASADVLTTAPTAAVASAQPAPAAQEVPDTLVGMASQLVATALEPLLSPNPAAPTHCPLLALLAWARREIQQTFFDRIPDVGPQTGAAQPYDPAIAPAVAQSPNLLVNPGAEIGDPSLSGYSSVTVPGWAVTGTPTVIEYGTPRRFPSPLPTPGPTLPAFLAFPSYNAGPLPTPPGGQQFFGGGPEATSTLTQIVDLSSAKNAIDQGNVPYELNGDLGGFTIDPSRASVTVDFLDVNGVKLDTGKIKPVTAIDRWFHTGLIHRDTAGTIPVGTDSAVVVVTLTDYNPVLGNYNNAYADNLSFTVGVDSLTPATLTPPASTVGELDHVFLVYMENKGFTDIVGSPNAPLVNFLIDTSGSASNYFGVAHPSDPNYYPILGGSDFGINYNCPANCFDEPNLADDIEAAGKTWAGYMEGGGGYSTPTDRLPFLAFNNIYSDPARVAAHLFDLTDMEGDLADPATAPNFAWFAADDASNMEGPTDTFVGLLQWAISQLTPPVLGGHQYNVAAGDEWLGDTLPIILNSPTWQDPNEKSAIFLTFDEDYNNLTTGIGNQGNHIVMVVIPSPGAVVSGMRGGAFVADGNYNHYSLQRTIEESLGLDPLTNNDKYAQPMNEFWE